jgi:hypothetical protein
MSFDQFISIFIAYESVGCLREEEEILLCSDVIAYFFDKTKLKNFNPSFLEERGGRVG